MFKRYDKKVTEPFAKKTIGLSFDKKYLDYYAPKSTDDFDYISPDGENALEVTIVIPKNEMYAYVYEKEKDKHKEKSTLKTSQIKMAKLNDDGDLSFYYGGSMGEIKTKIKEELNIKQNKAINRLKEKHYKSVDLCMCINDGSLFDQYSFELAFNDLNRYIFDNIFFITRSRFVVYNRNNGFKEYPRVIE